MGGRLCGRTMDFIPNDNWTRPHDRPARRKNGGRSRGVRITSACTYVVKSGRKVAAPLRVHVATGEGKLPQIMQQRQLLQRGGACVQIRASQTAREGRRSESEADASPVIPFLRQPPPPPAALGPPRPTISGKPTLHLRALYQSPAVPLGPLARRNSRVAAQGEDPKSLNTVSTLSSIM